MPPPTNSTFGLGGTIDSANVARARVPAFHIETGVAFINTPTITRPGNSPSAGASAVAMAARREMPASRNLPQP
jgi:acyl-CoA reductase-like NAD-dependent aldehyde dehydrogenase